MSIRDDKEIMESKIVDNRAEWRVKYERYIALKNCKHENWKYNCKGFKVCKFCKKIVGVYKPPCRCSERLFFF